jgi:hypothetical protein
MSERLEGGTKLSGLVRRAERVAANPFVALAALALGVVSAFAAMQTMGVDAQYPYLQGYGVRGGHAVFSLEWRQANVHDLTGYVPSDDGLYYPPAIGVVMTPLSLLPFTTAKILLLFSSVAAMVASVWVLFGLARPQTSYAARTTVAGLVLLSACARWSWTPVQLAPFFTALVVAALVGLHRGRRWMVYLATTLAFTLKLTLGVPFVLLLVLHRRFKTLVLAFATYVGLNAIGFARVGGREAIADYFEGTSALERRGTINTPNLWEHISIPRVDWTYLTTSLTGNLSIGRMIAFVGSVLVGVFLCLVGVRTPQPASLADSCRILLAGTCLGLVAVYHHHYDLAVLIPPLLLVAMLHRELGLTWSDRVTWSLMPITFVMLFVPGGEAADAAHSLVGGIGPGLVHAAFPAATTLAMVGSLAMVVAATGGIAAWKAWITAPRSAPYARPVS